MVGSIVKMCILIWLTSRLLSTFSSLEETSSRSLHFRFDTDDRVASSFPHLKDKRDASQPDSSISLEIAGEESFKKKADALSRVLKVSIDCLRNETDQVELVFLVDASGSVGPRNFQNELNFVKNLLSDFSVEPTATRVAVVTFGGRRHVRRNVDQISRGGDNDDKCYLLNKQLNDIDYTGGGTYTRGALLEALAFDREDRVFIGRIASQKIVEKGRPTAKKAVFLITDGFSNGGDPRPAANLLKGAGATIFTFGIRTGNVDELHAIASPPADTHSYFLDSFAEFQALVRRALHRDFKSGKYVPVTFPDNCNVLCEKLSEEGTEGNCCDGSATCTCGTATGHYACLCPPGYFGSGFKGFCHPCPNGTYASGEISGDSSTMCVPCPDANHVTTQSPATSIEQCVCGFGFSTDGSRCGVVTCSRLRVPENGYLVKAGACSNVVHAACGIRCRIGFYLTGDSIRLCGRDGSWSGNEARCLLKTCPVLRVPTHGRMRCTNEEGKSRESPSIRENSTAYPIDTRCQFKCEIGYQLRGSKIRNCLPLSQWDGLKATCKATKCEALKRVANGQIVPPICFGSEKVPFATTCTVTCKKGFALEGPRTRTCGGRSGVWTQRRTVTRCTDKTPPSFKCPANITVETFPGKNYALVNWTVPKVRDNVDEMPALWSKPYTVLPWKVKIGTRTISYVAQDSAGNKARCKFKITVLDAEPPKIERCTDPPAFYTNDKNGISNISWNEPGFYDNSKTSVEVEQNYFPGENVFPTGLTKVVYDAVDKYKNKATCVLNVTVKDICEQVPQVLNGYANCSASSLSANETNKCSIRCKDGFGFAVEDMDLRVTDNILFLPCDGNTSDWMENSFIPDCSETTDPNGVSQEGSVVVEGSETNICDNVTTLRELSEYITADLRSTLLGICGNDTECSLVTFDPECEENVSSSSSSSDAVYSNVVRRRRGLEYDRTNRSKAKMKRRKERIEIKLKVLGRIIEEHYESPREGVQKLRQKIESMTQSGRLNLLKNKTNQEIGKLALNLHLVFKNFEELCSPGSVLRKHACVKCPPGTFFDSPTKRCQPCPLGEYENTAGSLSCKRCPEHMSTKKIRSKHFADCTHFCKPGFYSRKRRYQSTRFALEPCLTCDFGYYQPGHGQTHCLACPPDTTTMSRGAKVASDCITFRRMSEGGNICDSQACRNGGLCVEEEDSFSCECPNYYIGAKCETFQNPCDSSPCLNEGTCNVRIYANNATTFGCACTNGYSGNNCEVYVDECASNPCKNNATCVSTENDYSCECEEGFDGEFCEIVVDRCDPSPCMEGSTCRSLNNTWHCVCKPGFLGRYCNLLPCDWLPCHENSYCVNIHEENATPMSYKCECMDGYTGEDCTVKIDHCGSDPCSNNGTCRANEFNTDYTCTCPVPFTGRYCETELSSDYVVHFAKSGTTDYVKTKGPSRNLLEVTTCLWLRSKDTLNYGTVLSYATRYHDNTFTLTDYNGLVIYLNGEKVVTDVKVNDGQWHFVCFTWKSKNGAWSVFVDGHLRDGGTRLAIETAVQGNGSLVIGQEQDRMGGGFAESESFLGELTLLDMWSRSLTAMEVERYFDSCEEYHGDVIAWSQLQEHVHGDVTVLPSPFCRGCPLPTLPFRGRFNVSQDMSKLTYYCDDGYTMRFRGKEHRAFKVKCLKQGQWEGYYPPVCARRKCGFPGYFPRGRIRGRSYLFGDEIRYSCLPGYELRGNIRRICNADGKWSGLPPVCIGKTCKNLLAPANGDIEYLVEEYERDDLTILQAGQQIEFKCDPGFGLAGEKFLTCLESGLWDHEEPVCVADGCPPPERVRNNGTRIGISLTDIDDRSNVSTSLDGLFPVGSEIATECDIGYKLIGDPIRICASNGEWSGLSFCEPTECHILDHPYFRILHETIDSSNFTTASTNGSYRGLEYFVEGHTYGKRIVLSCKLDGEFKPSSSTSSNFTWLCNERGMWELLGSDLNDTIVESMFGNGIDDVCQVAVCGSITIPEYSYIVEKTYSRTANSSVTFKCQQGYVLVGDEKSICLSNHSWSNSPTCKPVTCGKPPKLANAALKGNKEEAVNFPLDSTIYYECVPGYLMFGQASAKCLASGKWSKMYTRCSKLSCNKPKLPPGATVRGRSYLYQDQLIYVCPGGKKQGSIACKADGYWSEPPDCSAN